MCPSRGWLLRCSCPMWCQHIPRDAQDSVMKIPCAAEHFRMLRILMSGCAKYAVNVENALNLLGLLGADRTHALSGSKAGNEMSCLPRSVYVSVGADQPVQEDPVARRSRPVRAPTRAGLLRCCPFAETLKRCPCGSIALASCDPCPLMA